MESLTPTDGLRRPARKRVSSLHNDIKMSSDFVRGPAPKKDGSVNLSRSQSAEQQWVGQSAKASYKSSLTEEGSRPFKPSRMQMPQLIDPTHLRHSQRNASVLQREVVYLAETSNYNFTHDLVGTGAQTPLLLEYAPYDPMFTTTCIPPPMERFDSLSSGLKKVSQSPHWTWIGLPRLLGYFEDLEKSRFGLVYRFPSSLETTLLQNPHCKLPTLRDLLAHQTEPPLEAKFRLACNLTLTVFEMHARGIRHGKLEDKCITFCDVSSEEDEAGIKTTDIRRPLLSSFHLFPQDDTSTLPSPWYHPQDPQTFESTPSQNAPTWELYSLAMMLLSVGLWTNLESLLPIMKMTASTASVLERLRKCCGTLYTKAVQGCWQAAEIGGEQSPGTRSSLSELQMRICGFLETCCLLDDLNGLEEGRAEDLQDSVPAVPARKMVEGADIFEMDKESSHVPAQPPSAHSPKNVKRNAADNIEPSTSTPSMKTERVMSGQKTMSSPYEALSPDVVEKWNTVMMPKMNCALRDFYQKHEESVEISLEAAKSDSKASQATVLVVCSSVSEVRGILKQRVGKLFTKTTGISLKVCRGKMLRSRRCADSVSRSAARSKGADTDADAGDDDDEQEEDAEAANPGYQQCPSNGASIGAWTGTHHLPPVSLGGLVVVDGKQYGLTVHHMLGEPDSEVVQKLEPPTDMTPADKLYAELMRCNEEDEQLHESSDTESELYSDIDVNSDYGSSDDEDDEDFSEPGDTAGIAPGRVTEFIITQPALDDVEEDFYPSVETQNEDHLDSFSLGKVYASSGIRRKQMNELIHEVDWALIQFDKDRQPRSNTIPRFEVDSPDDTPTRNAKNALIDLRPTTVAPLSSLPGKKVQCMARTSGLQMGQILPTLASIKMFGRCSPSHTYQVSSTATRTSAGARQCQPIGIPGDSGAWVVDCRDGQVCGHVLAWSQRKRVAYICPMDVLLMDVAQTLGAAEVRLPLPGELRDEGKSERPSLACEQDRRLGGVAAAPGERDSDLESFHLTPESAQSSLHDEPLTVHGPNTSSQGQHRSPMRLETPVNVRGLTAHLEELNIGRTNGIGVN